jgi:two-component system, NarL family, nitrate/nitrite response regulator NarL
MQGVRMLSQPATAVSIAATRAISIVIAGDHGLFRAGLRRLLESESESDFLVVGEAANGYEAVDLVRALNPDVLLLDLSLAGRRGLDVLRTIAAPIPVPSQPRTPKPRTILLTAAIDDEEALEAMRLGAHGILPKDSPPPLLFKCVRAVASGERWLGRELVSNLVRHLQTSTSTVQDAHTRRATTDFGLTPRERQVVSAIADGSTNRDIAQRYVPSTTV